jgi:hypothetical protein
VISPIDLICAGGIWEWVIMYNNLHEINTPMYFGRKYHAAMQFYFLQNIVQTSTEARISKGESSKKEYNKF